ncbi:hypothetical protein BZA77DRAFT_360364 [Pyronema omphalodes]|nr:hypothetical protein BZA77DRAFT_360364 [Pyronema omphalodes]
MEQNNYDFDNTSNDSSGTRDVKIQSIYPPIYAASIGHGHHHYHPHHPNDPYDPHHPHNPHHLYHPYYPHHPNDPYDPHHPHHPHGPPYAPVAYGLNNPYGPPQAPHDLHNSEAHSYTPVAFLTDAHSRPVILPSLWSQVNGCVPIDPRLLQIDTYQRAAQGLPPFDPRPMVPMASGLKTVSVPPVAGTTATVRRKRVYGSRKKPDDTTPTTGEAAPTAPKRRRKAGDEESGLSTPLPAITATTATTTPTAQTTAEVTRPLIAGPVAAPPVRRRTNAAPTSVNAGRISTRCQIPASFLFNGWMPVVPTSVPKDQAADNASASGASGSAP